MAYCTVSDVRLIVSTSLTDSEISSIIAMSDAEIDKRLGIQDASDELIKKLSVLLTAHSIKTRQPKSVAISEYREDAGNVLEVFEREIEKIYQLYKGVSMVCSDYEHIEETKRYPEG